MTIPLLYDYLDDDDDDDEFNIMGRGFIPFARRDMSHSPDEKGSQLALIPRKKSEKKEDEKKKDDEKKEEEKEEPEEIFVDLNKK